MRITVFPTHKFPMLEGWDGATSSPSVGENVFLALIHVHCLEDRALVQDGGIELVLWGNNHGFYIEEKTTQPGNI